MKLNVPGILQFFKKFGKYHITIAIFLFVILIWDDNNIFVRISMENKINQLENDIEHYEGIIKESTDRLNELQTNSDNLEKFARENYLMKKKDEDIFIVEEEEKK